MIHNDINPSIVCGMFGMPEVLDAVVKDVHGKHGMRVREFRFIDVGIPLDERTEDALNYLKCFSGGMLKRLADMDFMGLKKKALGKMNLVSVEFPDPMWLMDRKHKFAYSGFTPMFVDEGYRKDYTDEQNKILDKVIKFESNFKDFEQRDLEAIEETIYSEEEIKDLKDRGKIPK